MKASGTPAKGWMSDLQPTTEVPSCVAKTVDVCMPGMGKWKLTVRIVQLDAFRIIEGAKVLSQFPT